MLSKKNFLSKKKWIGVLIIIAFLVSAAEVMGANLQSWNFNLPGNYNLSDSSKIKITNGLAKLNWNINPTFLGSYDTPISASDVLLDESKNIAYVTDHSGGLEIVNIANLSNPVPLANYNTPGFAWKLALSADKNTIYIADWNGGLQILNVTNPSAPTFIGSLAVAEANGIAISPDGNTAYVVGRSSGLEIIDITNPALPIHLGTFSIIGGAYEVIISSDGQTAYLANGTNGIKIIDISNSTNPLLLGSYDTPYAAVDLKLSSDENILYIGDYSNLIILDVSNNTSPTLLSSFNVFGTPGPLELSSDENTVYIASGTTGLQIIDVSDKSSPSFIASLDTLSADGIAISSDEDTIFLGDNTMGLRIIDVSKNYFSDRPYLSNSSATIFNNKIVSFFETMGSNNDGSVKYQVSTDNALTWKYWNGISWVQTTQNNGLETNTASEINNNISILDTDGGNFLWRAYFYSSGQEKVELDKVEINYDPVIILPSGKSGKKRSTASAGVSNREKTVYSCKNTKAVNFSNKGIHDKNLCIFEAGSNKIGRLEIERKIKELQKQIEVLKINLEKTEANKCPYFNSYFRLGSEDKEVYKIQEFLKERKFYQGDFSGIFDKETENAVKDFQLKYFSEVLEPWNLDTPTGRWYQSTRKKANDLMGCQEEVILDNGKKLS